MTTNCQSATLSPTRWGVAILLLLPVTGETQAATINAFGQAISVPSTAPAGTVIARQAISPNEACASDRCEITSVAQFPRGGETGSTDPIIPTTVPGVSARLIINGTPATTTNYSPPVVITRSMEVQLLADGSGVHSGKLGGAASGQEYFLLGITRPYDGLKLNLGINLRGTVTSIPGTCNVSTAPVTLPPVPSSRLPTVGSSSGGTAFTLNVERCPAGYNRVGYSLSQPNYSPQTPPGVLQPSASSSARGVNIQLTDSSGSGLELNRSHTMTEYSKTTGGSYKVPLRADYYRTGSRITPGTVTSDVTVALDYQ
ncbi:Fimbrial protein (plasmid) [Burkholderia ambifaria MC40-6]|uniref:Fimbrial protein n=2 Tax=Burkholderia ambifaria TaxID=152480 RepID=B1Z6I5_BURA4|nr:Fimbrial protein [Burkholderia ambifaria MC40-6]